MINRKKIGKIIYFSIIPVIMGAVVFSYFGRVTDGNDFIRKMILFIIIMVPISIIYAWFGDKVLFPNKDTIPHKILDKMERCTIRKEKGDTYCAKCPEGYECAKLGKG